jgi:hypothetical protein
MAAITIKDLPINLALDLKAMSSIGGGGGAPWVYAFKPFQSFDEQPQLPSALNFYQITNNFYAQNVIDKSQAITINNAAASSNITAVLVNAA